MGNYLWSAFILHKITPIIMKNIISLSPCQLCSWEAEKLLLCVRRQLTLVGDTTQLPSGDITRPAGGVLTGPQTCRQCCAILSVSEKATTSAFTSTHPRRRGFVGRQRLKTVLWAYCANLAAQAAQASCSRPKCWRKSILISISATVDKYILCIL